MQGRGALTAVAVEHLKVQAVHVKTMLQAHEIVVADFPDLDGIERHIELTVEGRPPEKRPGVACRWCPLQSECEEGRNFLHGDNPEVVADLDT